MTPCSRNRRVKVGSTRSMLCCVLFAGADLSRGHISHPWSSSITRNKWGGLDVGSGWAIDSRASCGCPPSGGVRPPGGPRIWLRIGASFCDFFYQLSIRKNANTQKPDHQHSQLDPHATMACLIWGVRYTEVALVTGCCIKVEYFTSPDCSRYPGSNWSGRFRAASPSCGGSCASCSG